MTVNKRYPLSLRTTKELRQKLEKAAAQSGKSLAQEIEARLEQSFDRQETIEIAVVQAVRELLRYRADWALGKPLKKK